MNVELVRVVTADGVRLEGSLLLPESTAVSRLPVDVMIFHHGVGGNLYNQTFFELIPGADHAYTNRTDQLWAAVEAWLGTA